MMVRELIPGDRIEQAGESAVFIAKCPHPYYQGFQLVVWYVDGMGWSHDALLSDQDVGEPIHDPQPTKEIQAKRTRLKQVFTANA
jgi:hypothetical protein